jgi:hypothetical protein
MKSQEVFLEELRYQRKGIESRQSDPVTPSGGILSREKEEMTCNCFNLGDGL